MARDAEFVRTFRLAAEQCPIPPAVELIGERWTCLILRGAMLGLCHFEEFQACLGIARNILSDRLGRLVSADILTRSPDPHDRRKVVYALTERGANLLPLLVALRQWAMDAGLGKPSLPQLCDRRDRQPVGRMTVLSHDGRPLSLEDLVWVGANGEEFSPPLPEEAKQAAA